MALAIGSLPQARVTETLELISSSLPEAPLWPQLPNRSFLEGMYVQYAEGFPGACLDPERKRLYIETQRPGFADELTAFYEAFLAADWDYFAIARERASGLWEGLETLAADYRESPPRLVKGQVTGPVSFGLGVTDADKRSIIYDETLFDVVARHINGKAHWQEEFLQRCFPGVPTLTFLDEPYMVSFGTAFCSLSREQVRELINQAAAGLAGLTGVHCCGNTDWSLLLDTEVDLLNFDAYEYGDNLLLYGDEVKAFLDAGGYLAWGVVPTSPAIDDETVASLYARLMGQVEELSRLTGIEPVTILRRSFVTPSCGAGSLTPERAVRVFYLTRELSEALRNDFAELVLN
jgi:hypothetical protein